MQRRVTFIAFLVAISLLVFYCHLMAHLHIFNRNPFSQSKPTMPTDKTPLGNPETYPVI
jgi:hypothetical protein